MNNLQLALVFVGILILLWLIMAAPIGRRTISRTILIKASRERLWSALFPLGENYNWEMNVSRVETVNATDVRIVTTHEDREGQPIERVLALTKVEPLAVLEVTVTDDTALDTHFWKNYVYAVKMADRGDGCTEVTISETDAYKGIGFAVFRFFSLRRKALKLSKWALTNRFRKGGIFEHPLTQFGMACISTILIWPLFGLDAMGFGMAAILTAVVGLHELGHVAAFRVLGHKSARLIFLPLLGGIAMGGRPYNRQFEVAFAALMGAGISVFVLCAVYGFAQLDFAQGSPVLFFAVFFVLICGFFNLANLLPIWKFDGGQVLRQVFRNPQAQAVASACMLAFFVAVGILAGLAWHHTILAALVVLVLSLLTGRNGIVPKKALEPMAPQERTAIIFGLTATCVTHAMGALWAWQQIQA